VGGVNTRTTTTSAATTFTMPSYTGSANIAKSVTSSVVPAKLESSSCVAWSKFLQPSVSGVLATEQPRTAVITKSEATARRTFVCSSPNVATKTTATASRAANTEVSWTSGVANNPLTRVTTSNAVVLSSGSDASQRVKEEMLSDRMRPAPAKDLHAFGSAPVSTSHRQATNMTAVCASNTKVTANGVSTHVATQYNSDVCDKSRMFSDRSRPTPVQNSYTSGAKNSAVLTTSQSGHSATVTTSYAVGRRPLMAPQQTSSTKTGINDDDGDRTIVSGLLQKLAEARERKLGLQSRFVSSATSDSAVQPHSPIDSVVLSSRFTVTNSLLLSAGGKMTTVGRGSGTTTLSNKTDWQMEAERRQKARNGVYIDPEKPWKQAVHHQDIGRQQLPNLHTVGYTSTLTQVPPKSQVSTAGKMHSPTSSNTSTTSAALSPRLSPLQVSSTSYDVRDAASVSHHRAARPQKDPFKSKKSVSKM